MPQKVLKFSGINRRANEFQSSGGCEELINLRPAPEGGYYVVKDKYIHMSDVKYSAFYEHRFGDTYNVIVVTTDGNVRWIDSSGKSTLITDTFAGKNITISSAGNVIVIYCEEKKQQLVYKFENGTYNPYDVTINAITDIEVTYNYKSASPSQNKVVADDGSISAINDALHKAASGFYDLYPNGLCGASVVGCTYELEDGSEICSTAFVVANSARINGISAPETKDGTNVIVYGASKAVLHLTFGDTASNGVKRVNIYASRPVFQYEAQSTSQNTYRIADVPLADVGLSGQLMYYQCSVEPKGEVSFTLNFSKTLSGERVLEVDSGCIERIGESISYNNRFHYYKSDVQHIIQIPTISDFADDRTSSSHWVAYVKINDKWILVNKDYRFNETVPNDFIYPMSGVKKLAFVKADYPQGGEFSVPYSEMFYVNLTDSSAYNYSCAFDVTPEMERDEEVDYFHEQVTASGQIWGNPFTEKILWKKEINAINVSAQFNPFVFPVEYSYSFTGEVIDLATSYLPVSSTQIGQYPLTVFTTGGVFSMEQGDGSVLYSNILPLQPLVITGKAKSTPYGTFFVSSNNLYVLSGREVANVSYVLNGERELSLRDVEAYKRLSFDKTGTFHDFTRLVSDEDFKEFIDNSILTYDQLHNELYISSTKNSDYSYVFNLDTKAYHKVAKRYLDAQSGSRYIIEITKDRDGVEVRNVVDMHNEVDAIVPVFMQSRPVSLDALYTHIQRLLLMVAANLQAKQHLCISVFGSDNLHDWKCIISSQKQKDILRQIRTNRSAKSYKDYIILINGLVHTDTDIYELIADYTFVNRRLG